MVVLCAVEGEIAEIIDEEQEVEIVPSQLSLPLATLLYAPSNTLAGDFADVSPVSAAIARHMGINLTPDGIAARNRRGIAIIVYGAPLSGVCCSLFSATQCTVIICPISVCFCVFRAP